jgi:hypothetical protein
VSHFVLRDPLHRIAHAPVLRLPRLHHRDGSTVRFTHATLHDVLDRDRFERTICRGRGANSWHHRTRTSRERAHHARMTDLVACRAS